MKSPQINLDTIKEALKKLSFLKNNLALLVPIIIAVVAVLLFIPAKLLSARLKNTITEQSVKPAGTVTQLIEDVNAAGEAEAMVGYVEAYAQDANQIANLMKQTTMRELLTYKIFPDSNETSPLLFEPVRKEFLAGVDAMIERLGAGDPPTDVEIQAALEKSSPRSMYGRGGAGGRAGGGASAYGYGGGYGGAYGMTQGLNLRMMPEADRRIVDKLCEDKAKAIRLYASPADLDGYSFWSDWKYEDWKKAVRQSWNWQMGYWILEDVVDTVDQMNKNSSSVVDAPVKRVMSVAFTLSKGVGRTLGARRSRGMRMGVASQQQQAMPTYVISLKTALAAPPCTGRYCNEDVDIMHFNVRVIVDADQVMPFIQELCSAKTHKFRGWFGEGPEQTFKHNQIAILETNVLPIDLEGFEHSSYRYGNAPVVDLDLICEYQFYKKGYERVVPKEIKNDIAGVADDAATN